MEDSDMHKLTIVLAVIFLFSLLLSACTPSGDSGPGKAAEAYLNALVSGDADRMSALSCATWEENALLELDSFMAVDATAVYWTNRNGGQVMRLAKP